MFNHSALKENTSCGTQSSQKMFFCNKNLLLSKLKRKTILRLCLKTTSGKQAAIIDNVYFVFLYINLVSILKMKMTKNVLTFIFLSNYYQLY